MKGLAKLAVGSILVFVIATVAAVWLAEPPKVAYRIDFCTSCGAAKFRVAQDDQGVTLKRCWSCTKGR